MSKQKKENNMITFYIGKWRVQWMIWPFYFNEVAQKTVFMPPSFWWRITPGGGRAYKFGWILIQEGV